MTAETSTDVTATPMYFQLTEAYMSIKDLVRMAYLPKELADEGLEELLRDAEQEDEDVVGDEEDGASILVEYVWEPPDAPEADCRSERHQPVLVVRLPLVSLTVRHTLLNSNLCL